jgi:hypothetical protein
MSATMAPRVMPASSSTLCRRFLSAARMPANLRR